MGNCATCCGKADGNEISTEKTVTRGAKGVQQEYYENGDALPAQPPNGKILNLLYDDFYTCCFHLSNIHKSRI